jgi:hypothetical protein
MVLVVVIYQTQQEALVVDLEDLVVEEIMPVMV